MKRKAILSRPAILISTIIVGILYLLPGCGTPDTTLEFQVIDTVSKHWVWDFTVTLQDRYIKGYYQSNTDPIVYTFTGLEPGDWTLEVTAPHYESVTRPVHISPGRNRIPDPIGMTGYEIPGISEMFVFKEMVDGRLILNPRPINDEGLGIGMHPCLDMWFGLRVSVQVKDGVITEEPTEKGSERGEELFRGSCDWEWDPNPDTYYRYIVPFPGEKIKHHNAPYRVYDYIIVLPDPRKINRDELDEEMEKALAIPEETELKRFLDTFNDKIIYFISTDWNQPAIR